MKNVREFLFLVIIPLVVLLIPMFLAMLTGNNNWYWGFTVSWMAAIVSFFVGVSYFYEPFFEEREANEESHS